MNVFLQFVIKHGYPIVFAAVFARQIGLPVPAPAFLIAAGALAAEGKFALAAALTLAVIACVLADWIWYEAGRRMGERVLHFIYRLARNPEAHERCMKEAFARHGPPLLVMDKFFPGLDAVVPPMAGTAGTSRICFLSFETIGASVWAAAYSGVGYVFSRDLSRAAVYAARMGSLAAVLVLAGVCAYAAPILLCWRRSMRKSQRVGMIKADSVGAAVSVTDGLPPGTGSTP